MVFKKDCIYYVELSNPKKPIYEIGNPTPTDFEKIPVCLKNNFVNNDEGCPDNCPFYRPKS